MRFDDMIATVLAGPDAPERRPARWQQLVDLLAQRRPGSGGEEEAHAFAYLRRHRNDVPSAVRRRSAASLAGLAIDPELVAFFAEDSPRVAAPLIGGVRLPGGDWLALLPRLGPSARALLRHRRDLDREVRRALDGFGPADFMLERAESPAEPVAAAAPPQPLAPSVPSPPPPPTAEERAESQIRELVDRIEAFRRQKEEQPAPTTRPAPVDGFRWEAGSDGIIRWVEGAPRAPLVGQSIAAIAPPGQHGVDGQAAGAFEKRAPFRDARFCVAGEGSAAGDWRISGVPFFDPQRGNFLGYRGTARRPRLDETATGLFGPQLPADSLRQLIHELRTPLNAIIGFAEMIEGQHLGPAARPYRGQAAEIVEQAHRLLAAVEDLDTAARIETRRLDLEGGAIDAAALVARLHASYARVAEQRGTRILLEIDPDLPLARAEPAAAERMIARAFAATIGLAEPGETIPVRLAAARRGGRTTLHLAIGRPRAVGGLDEAALLDPGYSPDGDWPDAPALGLGFALRLVRNLAETAGGGLEIGEEDVVLFLPTIAAQRARAGEGV